MQTSFSLNEVGGDRLGRFAEATYKFTGWIVIICPYWETGCETTVPKETDRLGSRFQNGRSLTVSDEPEFELR